jgi:hypothetical protein
MKNILLKILGVFLFTALAVTTSFAQASATANATATIITPIGISKTIDMNFGTVAVSATIAGTVILATDGSRTTGGAGGVTLPSFDDGSPTAAEFAVTGEGTYTYAITLPASITLDDGASHSMTVDTFTSNPSGTGALTAGAQTLLVGATLNVSAGQAAGTYSNTTDLTVTVNYN